MEDQQVNVFAGIYRVIIGALFFIFFGTGALCISVVAFNLIRLFVRNKDLRTQLSRNITRYSFVFFLKSGCVLGIFDIEVNNLLKIKNDRGCVYIANHPSLLDIVILCSIVKNANCVVKAQLLNNPFLSGVIRCNRYVPNAQDAPTIIKNCSESLNRGDNLIIFPEGSRTVKPNSEIRFKHGFASLALFGMHNIRPLTIKFTGLGLKKNTPWYYVYYRRLKYTVSMLDEFDTAAFCREYEDKEDSALARLIARKLESLIKSNL
ncbi:MAG: lysophospholipid acyltransferase family protein [Succinivibrio sp.]